MAQHQQPIVVEDNDEDDDVQLLEDGEDDDLEILDAEPIVAEIRLPLHTPGQERVADRAQRRRLDDDLFTVTECKLDYPDGSTTVITVAMKVQCEKTGDILEIYGISEEQGGRRYIRCLPFCSTLSKSLGNMLEKFPDEVCMIQQVFPGDDEPHNRDGKILYDFCTEDLGRLKEVDLIFTNAKKNKDPAPPPRNGSTSMPTLICRWKLTQVFRTPRCSKDRKTLRQAFQRLRFSECSPGHGVSDSLFRAERDIDCSNNPSYRPPGLDGLFQATYTFLDAFSGSGFASLGALLAGLRLIGAFDNNENAQLNYSHNFKKVKLWRMSQNQFLRTRAARYRGRVDVLHISFPCKYYSSAHTRPGKNDPENSIAILGLSEFLRIIRPRIVVIEETSGLAECMKHRDSIQSLINDFTRVNYEVEHAIRNFAENGLAQNRRRLIIIAAAPGDTLPDFIRPTHNVLGKPHNPSLLPPVTVGTVLETRVPKHLNHNPRDSALQNVPPARDYDAYQRQLGTITCGGGGKKNCVYPTGVRDFTHFETMLLQGATARHELLGNRTEIKARIGDAFPSIIAKQIYEECIKSLRETDRQEYEYRQRLADKDLTQVIAQSLLAEDERSRSERQSSRDRREIIVPTDGQLSNQKSTTPKRNKSTMDQIGEELFEIGEEEYRNSTPSKRRNLQVAETPPRPQSPTPAPRSTVTPRPRLLADIWSRAGVAPPMFYGRPRKPQQDQNEVD